MELSVGEVVCGWADQPIVQLHRPACGDVAEEQGGDCLGERAGRSAGADVSATAPRSAEVFQCAEVAGREEGRPGGNLHGNDSRVAGGDAGVRADWRAAYGGVWRIL